MSKLNAPVIPEELWLDAKQKTFALYDNSMALPYLQQALCTFEQTNRTKYFSDLCEFIFESSIEDFCDISKADIAVSTIHKAKGREFDNVYMLISEPKQVTDVEMRRYYVAMTRAKRTLSIHTTCHNSGNRLTGNVFSKMTSTCRSIDAFSADETGYALPDEIILQMSHKDIWLHYSKDYKREILSLRSGDRLQFCRDGFCIPKTGQQIVKLSHKMKDGLAEWEERGYQVTGVSVMFIVAWKPKDAPEGESEMAVVLAELQLHRTAKNIRPPLPGKR